MNVEWRDPATIRPYEKNARDNSQGVHEVAKSLAKFGWQQPIVVDPAGTIVAGHTRWAAACSLGMKEVPVLVATGLTEAELKAYRLADNRTHEFSKWKPDLLVDELREIAGLDEDLKPEFLGFNMKELVELEDDAAFKFESGTDRERVEVLVRVAPEWKERLLELLKGAEFELAFEVQTVREKA
jgi:ParB-like chromosome segregation protein Spo0J